MVIFGSVSHLGWTQLVYTNGGWTAGRRHILCGSSRSEVENLGPVWTFDMARIKILLPQLLRVQHHLKQSSMISSYLDSKVRRSHFCSQFRER